MIIGIYGKDSFRSREYLHRLIESFHAKYDKQGLAVQRWDRDNITPERIYQGVSGGGLFNNKQLIIIERFFHELNDRTVFDILGKKFDQLKDDQDQIVIFWEDDDKPKNNGELFSKITKLKISRRFDPLSVNETKKWISESFKRERRNCSPDLAQWLFEMCGNDLWRLHNEIEKIIHFTPKENISSIDAKKVISISFHEDSFLFVNALIKKDMERAMYILEEQWRSDVHPLILLGSIVWQFRTIMVIKEWMENPSTLNVFKKMRLHPYVVKKNTAVARNFSWEQLKNIYQTLQSIEEKIKTGQGDPKAQLSLFVVRVCNQEVWS